MHRRPVADRFAVRRKHAKLNVQPLRGHVSRSAHEHRVAPHVRYTGAREIDRTTLPSRDCFHFSASLLQTTHTHFKTRGRNHHLVSDGHHAIHDGTCYDGTVSFNCKAPVNSVAKASSFYAISRVQACSAEKALSQLFHSAACGCGYLHHIDGGESGTFKQVAHLFLHFIRARFLNAIRFSDDSNAARHA